MSPEETTLAIQEPMKAKKGNAYWGGKVRNEEEGVARAGSRVVLGEAGSENDHVCRQRVSSRKEALSNANN